MKDKDTSVSASRSRADEEVADWLSGRGSAVMAALVVLLVIGFVVSLFW